MSETPPLFVRVSLQHGHFTVPAVTAERGGWRVLKQDALDKHGRPLPPKPRVDVEEAPKPRKKRPSNPRVELDAATPNTEAPASDGTLKE